MLQLSSCSRRTRSWGEDTEVSEACPDPDSLLAVQQLVQQLCQRTLSREGAGKEQNLAVEWNTLYWHNRQLKSSSQQQSLHVHSTTTTPPPPLFSYHPPPPPMCILPPPPHLPHSSPITPPPPMCILPHPHLPHSSPITPPPHMCILPHPHLPHSSPITPPHMCILPHPHLPHSSITPPPPPPPSNQSHTDACLPNMNSIFPCLLFLMTALLKTQAAKNNNLLHAMSES